MPLKFLDYIFVTLQFLLFGAFLLVAGPRLDFIKEWLQYSGVFLGILGALICVVALAQLNTHLSPFPTPIKGSSLISNGVYTWVRHPIYSGILLGLLGLSLYYQSAYKIGIVIALLILFYFKSSYEEQRLEAVFAEYPDYKVRTKRFIPFLL